MKPLSLALLLGLGYVIATNKVSGGSIIASPTPGPGIHSGVSTMASSNTSSAITQASTGPLSVEALRARRYALIAQRNELRHFSAEEQEKARLMERNAGLTRSGITGGPEFLSNQARIDQINEILRQRSALANSLTAQITALDREEQALIRAQRR